MLMNYKTPYYQYRFIATNSGNFTQKKVGQMFATVNGNNVVRQVQVLCVGNGNFNFNARLNADRCLSTDGQGQIEILRNAMTC